MPVRPRRKSGHAGNKTEKKGTMPWARPGEGLGPGQKTPVCLYSARHRPTVERTRWPRPHTCSPTPRPHPRLSPLSTLPHWVLLIQNVFFGGLASAAVQEQATSPLLPRLCPRAAAPLRRHSA